MKIVRAGRLVFESLPARKTKGPWEFVGSVPGNLVCELPDDLARREMAALKRYEKVRAEVDRFIHEAVDAYRQPELEP